MLKQIENPKKKKKKKMKRINTILNHLKPQPEKRIIETQNTSNDEKKETLTVIDNRTGKKLEVSVKDGFLHSNDLKSLNLIYYDPGLMRQNFFFLFNFFLFKIFFSIFFF